MTFDIEKIQESKQAMRRRLAALPVAEKLSMLDAMRERAETLRTARPAMPAGRTDRPWERRGDGP